MIYESRTLNHKANERGKCLKLSCLRKNDSWKMYILKILDSWDQKINSWFTNHEPLITKPMSVVSAFTVRSYFHQPFDAALFTAEMLPK